MQGKKAGASTKIGLLAVAAALLATGAEAATSGNGTVSADVGQLVEITVTDASVALTEASPTSGQETVARSTTDYLRFSNAKANVQEVWNFGLSVGFTKDADATTTTDGTVSYQGTSKDTRDLLYLAQSSSGSFLPWRLVTPTSGDLTSEGATGWTPHASCGTTTYQGYFTVASYNNAGVAQTALTKYYRVCDSGAEIYISDSKDLSAADAANIYTTAVSGSSATAANYEVAISGVDYVFYSAATATTVTLRQGLHVALGTSSNTGDLYALVATPDGFPAGTVSATVTATASDIVS